jgi:hypothetical protein
VISQPTAIVATTPKMAFHADRHHEDLVEEVATRMESSKLSRRPSRNSTGLTPKRYSARIEKPRSNHPSPRGLERRRTVSAAKQYATLDDHYRIMFGLDADGSKEEGHSREHNTARPVSWHPSSSHFQGLQTRKPDWSSLQPQPPSQHQNTLVTNKYTEADTPISNYNEQHPHLADLAWSSYMHGQVTAESEQPSYSSLSCHSNTSWHSPALNLPADTRSSYLHPTQSDRLFLEQPIARHSQESNEGRHRLVRKKSDELIGLGLYDPPESSPSAFGVGSALMGKGLKLEETWQPPEEMEEDEDEDEGAESSEEEEEPPHQLEQQWPQNPLPLMNLSGQSFFFEDEEGVANEWWYQQMKQPAAVPRDGALAYNWV